MLILFHDYCINLFGSYLFGLNLCVMALVIGRICIVRSIPFPMYWFIWYVHLFDSTQILFQDQICILVCCWIELAGSSSVDTIFYLYLLILLLFFDFCFFFSFLLVYCDLLLFLMLPVGIHIRVPHAYTNTHTPIRTVKSIYYQKYKTK